MGKLDKIRQIVNEIVKDCEKQKKEDCPSAEGRGMFLLAKTIRDAIAK